MFAEAHKEKEEKKTSEKLCSLLATMALLWFMMKWDSEACDVKYSEKSSF